MGQYLPWLIDAARATGYPVVELSGWRGHHHGPMAGHIYGVVCHHTAGPDPYPGARNDFPSLNVVRNGRPGLPGPLAQLGLGWNGTVYIVSGGLAYHAGSGAWRNVGGNSRYIGIEAEDDGDGDWSPPQLECYPRLVASLLDYLGSGAGWCCGHREYAPHRKIDPAGIDLHAFRRRVGTYLAAPHTLRRGARATDVPTTTSEESVAIVQLPHTPASADPDRDDWPQTEQLISLGYVRGWHGRCIVRPAFGHPGGRIHRAYWFVHRDDAPAAVHSIVDEPGADQLFADPPTWEAPAGVTTLVMAYSAPSGVSVSVEYEK